MEQEIKGLSDYLAILNRRKKHLISSVLIILLISIGLAVGLPSIYRSEATILIEQQQIPMDMVRSTVTSYAGERIQMISQMVMTTENLGKIIKDYDLYREELAKKSLSTVVEGMRQEVTLEMISADVVDPRSGRPTTAAIAFKVSFSHESARLSQKVTNELVSLYLNENLRRRTQTAVETSGFMASELDKLKDEVADLETLLAQFKERNINSLPELQQVNIRLMDRVEWELRDLEQQVRSLDERKVYLHAELSQVSAMSVLYSSDGSRILSAEDKLRSMQAEYASVSARYSSSHPDVITMGKEIEALKKEAKAGSGVRELQVQLAELRNDYERLSERYSAQHPDVTKLQREIVSVKDALDVALKESVFAATLVSEVKPDNPAYIQLQAQINAVESQLASLLQSKKEYKDKINEFETRLLNSPQVEREYRALTRDYENTLAEYRSVKSKKNEAELAESLERERKGERFSLIEPPQLPEKPSKPNRMAIFFIGIVFSLAGGIGVVALLESLNASIKNPNGLVSVIDGLPLVVVPYIDNTLERSNKRKLLWGAGGLAVALGVGAVVGLHLMVMPLDVAWFVILRRLGLAA